MVDLGGYVIILAESKDAKIKLYGSPADRSECDEILEINGQNLENSTHEHVIQFIHQCIKTRTICLRVKRKASGKLVCDKPLVDAFVIGSRAREHLKQITKDTCHIIPRDIAQISRILSSGEASAESGSSPTPGIVSPSAIVSTKESTVQPSTSSPPKQGEAKSCSGTPARKSSSGVNVTTSSIKTGSVTTTVEVVHHKSVENIKSEPYSFQSQDPTTEQASSSSSHQHPHSGHQRHRRHSRTRTSRCDSAQSRKSVPESSRQARDSSDPSKQEEDDKRILEPFYPQSSLRQRSISFDSHQPLFDQPNVVTTSGGTIVTTSALTVSDYTLNSSTRVPLKFGRYTHHHPHFYHHQVSRRPSVPVDVLATSSRQGIPLTQGLEPRSGDKDKLLGQTQVTSDSVTTEREELSNKNMELMELRRTSGVSSAGNNANYVVGSINNNISRGNVTKISIEHRELPVDVPDSFVGVVKQAPRYPPPHPVTPCGTLTSTDSVVPSYSSSSRKGSTSTSNRSTDATTTTKVQSVPQKVLSSSSSSSAAAVSSSSSVVPVEKGGSSGPKAGGKKYSADEQMSRKRLDGDQFLRTSQQPHGRAQLEQQKQKVSLDVVDYSVGGTNPAFQSDEEHDYQNLGRLQEQNKVLPVTELESVVARLSSPNCPLNSDVKQLIHRSNLNKLVSIYQSVMIQKQNINSLNTGSGSDSSGATILSSQQQPVSSGAVSISSPSSSSRNIPSLNQSSCDLMQEIISILQEESSLNQEAAELLEILTRFELEGVCYAFDQILASERLSSKLNHPSQLLSSGKIGISTSTSLPNKGHPLEQHQQQKHQSAIYDQPHSDSMQMQGLSKIRIEDSVPPSSSNPLKSSKVTSFDTVSSSVITTDAAPTRTSRQHHTEQQQQQFHPSSFHPQTTTLQHPLQQLQTQGVIALTDDDSIKMVQIEKSISEPLGATVRNEPDGSVIIGRIVKGGAAEKSGLLHEGDEILEVNGIQMKGMNVNQVCDLLAEMTGTLTLVIGVRESLSATIPTSGPTSTLSQMSPHHPSHSQHPAFHLRALFDYDPDDDLYIPCRELGICFTKGDILHVIDQSDTNWWQAYREGESDQTLAGLIPSISFQVQRETIKQSLIQDSSPNNRSLNSSSYHNNNNNNLHGYYPARSGGSKPSGSRTSASSMILFNCGKKSHQKRKKRKDLVSSSPDGHEILTYEEVSLYYPRANIKRPIVLIGPTNIGRHELRQRLMMDTERFAAAVPHTSRSKREGEIDTIDYHFITRSQFESDIRDGKFVEHGEYEKNYYGTSLSAIEAVVQSGKICVLNLHIHSIPILRQGHAGSRLKPYFVFVSPAHGSVEEAREIEDQYGHYFDLVLKMTDLDRAYEQLLNEINNLEKDPQWIPSDWLK